MRIGWTRISDPFKKEKSPHKFVLCRCVCGKEAAIRLTPDGNLRSKSCIKCIRHFAKQRTAKHGHCRGDTPTMTYSHWQRMRYRARSRCEPLEPKWQRFLGFLEEMGERPSRTAVLRRMNEGLGWVAGNVAWVEI